MRNILYFKLNEIFIFFGIIIKYNEQDYIDS